jgi:hypothetical protein
MPKRDPIPAQLLEEPMRLMQEAYDAFFREHGHKPETDAELAQVKAHFLRELESWSRRPGKRKPLTQLTRSGTR